MKATVGAFATVLVTVWQAYPLAQPAPVGQLGPESVILRRAAANILDVEPAWRFGSAICNCAPLTDEQVGVAAGSWRQPGNGSLRSIDVRVHGIAHPQAASQWIDVTAPNAGAFSGTGGLLPVAIWATAATPPPTKMADATRSTSAKVDFLDL